MHIVRISTVWCSSCIVTYQAFLEFKKEHPHLIYTELDYDQEDTKKYKVKNTLPLVVFEKEGVEVARIEGEHQKKDLEAIYEKAAL